MNNKVLEFSSILSNFKESAVKLILILCVSLIIGIGMGTTVYFRQGSSAETENSVPEQSQTLQEVYVLSVEEWNQFTADVIQEMYQHKEYYENSILMHVNPYEIYTEKLHLKVELDDVDADDYAVLLTDIGHAYNVLLTSEECYEYVCEKTNIEVKKVYLEELISIDFTADNASAVKSASSMIDISVIGASQEMSVVIMDALEEYLREKNDYVQRTVYPHEISTFLRESTIACNPDLDTRQRAQRMYCAYYYGSGGAEAISNTFRLMTDFSGSSNTAVTSAARPFLYYVVLYGVLGCIIGIVLIVIYILIKCFKDQRIYNYTEYCEKHNLEKLEVAAYNKKDSALFLFDLNKLLKPYAGQKVTFVCIPKVDIPEVWNEMAKKANISVQLLEGLAEDVESLEKIVASDNILFVCQSKKTTYREVESIIKRIDVGNTRICGMIVA